MKGTKRVGCEHFRLGWLWMCLVNVFFHWLFCLTFVFWLFGSTKTKTVFGTWLSFLREKQKFFFIDFWLFTHFCFNIQLTIYIYQTPLYLLGSKSARWSNQATKSGYKLQPTTICQTNLIFCKQQVQNLNPNS